MLKHANDACALLVPARLGSAAQASVRCLIANGRFDGVLYHKSFGMNEAKTICVSP